VVAGALGVVAVGLEGGAIALLPVGSGPERVEENRQADVYVMEVERR
jgi:hypothetical protein